MSFVHLRVHSEYSFLRGACRLEALVERARELGMPAVALTDYGVLHGAVRFARLAKQYGIKPILGAEFTLPGGLPLVLLVRNKTGWENLLQLVNHFQLIVPKQSTLAIEKIIAHAEGLTALLYGYNEFELSEDMQAVEHALATLLPSFAPTCYLALEETGLPGTERVNRRLADIAGQHGVPLLATHNVHYVLPGDDPAYRMVNCIRTGKPLAGAWASFLLGANYDVKAPAEMVRRFAAYPGACENTQRVAAECEFVLEREGMHMPVFQLPGGEKTEDALRRLCRKGLIARGLAKEEAIRRLERELAVIIPKGLSSYFLIVHDLVCYAREQEIPVGPGRGSAGGSLVAYLLGITQVDPLAHGLYFERFLSEDRAEFPDIDLDVCQRRREELLSYLRERYGEGTIAQVSAFSTLGARAAVREVGKVLDLSSEKVSAVAEALPHYAGKGGIEAAVTQYPEFLTSRLQDEATRTVLSGARRLEGFCRHLSTHASGIIIGVQELKSNLPLCRGPAGEVLTQWDKDDVEAMGYLKIDVLGSRNLTIIHDTLASVRARHGSAPTPEKIPVDDDETYTALRRGQSLGCFQLESSGMRRVLRRLAPERLEDLVHLLSLYRPGPWESGMVDTFIARRHGQETGVGIHPALDELLADTYGVVLYQEQVMRIACELGGYTPGEADRLRREMSRRSPALSELYRPRFVTGAKAKGLKREEAEALFDHLCRFAGYSFNKAHSAAYALVSYWTAYLKQHYPIEFYAALLSTGFGYYGPVVYVHEAQSRGISILPPHVNKSGMLFIPEGNAIRAALPLVRDLGARGAQALLSTRQNGEYTSLRDFSCRVGRSALRRSAVANLIKTGAFAGLGFNRRQALASLDHVLKWTDRQPGQMSILELLPQDDATPELPDFTTEEILAAEAENLGMTLLAHPLRRYDLRLQQPTRVMLAELATIPPETHVRVAAVTVARSRRRVKRGGVMLTLFISDESGFAEAVCFPTVYKRLLYHLNESALQLTGKVTAEGDAIVVEAAQPLLLMPTREEKARSTSK